MFRMKVKEAAMAQGISQSRLSRLADIDPKVVRRIYQHPDRSISITTLDRLAIALGVDISTLIESVAGDQEP